MSNHDCVNDAPQGDDAKRAEIVERFASGDSVAGILRDLGVKFSTYRNWRETIQQFDKDMDCAQEAHIEAKLDHINGALDYYPNPQAAKVYSDNAKWILSKLDPARFGDKLDLTHHNADLTEVYQAALERVAARVLPIRDQHETLDATDGGNTGVFSVSSPDSVSDD